MWAKPLADGDRAVALLNRSDQTQIVRTSAEEIAMDRRAGYVLRDLWSHTETFTAGVVSASVPAHGVVMLRVLPGTPDEAAPATELAIGTPQYFAPGEEREVSTTLANHGRIAIEDVQMTFDAPSGWTVTATSGTSFDDVAPAVM